MLFSALCSGVTIGMHMTFDFSPSTNYTAGTTFTAICEDGFAFLWYNSGSWITATQNVGQCGVGNSNNGEVIWKYDYGSSLGDCQIPSQKLHLSNDNVS